MSAVRITEHAQQRAKERGLAPFVLRKALRYARNEAVLVLRSGHQIVIRRWTVTTVMAPGMGRAYDLRVIEVPV